jgi:hypothetical protein
MNKPPPLILPGPRKELGWCEANGVAHAWTQGPTLTMQPPIPTRVCVNCGKKQYLHQEWKDRP